MKVTFSETAIQQYFDWQNEDKKTLRRINELIIKTNDLVALIRRFPQTAAMNPFTIGVNTAPTMPEAISVSRMICQIWR